MPNGAEFIGRARLGDYLPIGAVFTSGRQLATPAAAPTVTIYQQGSNTAVIAARPMPQWGLCPSMFGFGEFLGSAYTTGRYLAVVAFTSQTKLFLFEVVPGGDPGGCNTSLAWFSRPQTDYLVTSNEAGVLSYHAGPSL